MAHFLQYFLNPDGTVGGEYGSRNTEYIYPHGLELLCLKNPTINHIRNSFLNLLRQKKNQLIDSLDDRYFMFMCYNYLQASVDFSKHPFHVPKTHMTEKYFNQAGIYIKSTQKYKLLANLKKGGIFRLDTKKFSYIDSGLFGITDKGKLLSSQQLSNNSISGLKVKGHLSEIPSLKISPSIQLAVKFFNLTAPPFLRRFFLDFLRKKAVNASLTDSIFLRELSIKSDYLIITDKITSKTNFRTLRPVLGKIKAMHFASTSFFQPQELSFLNHKIPDFAKHLNKPVTLERRINLKKANVEVYFNGSLESN